MLSREGGRLLWRGNRRVETRGQETRTASGSRPLTVTVLPTRPSMAASMRLLKPGAICASLVSRQSWIVQSRSRSTCGRLFDDHRAGQAAPHLNEAIMPVKPVPAGVPIGGPFQLTDATPAMMHDMTGMMWGMPGLADHHRRARPRHRCAREVRLLQQRDCARAKADRIFPLRTCRACRGAYPQKSTDCHR